jgi:sulfur-carrier protein adenylyltransferase/sulfurtransferase
MINHTLKEDELIRYSQQINLDEIDVTGQEKLKNARVLCIGIGGLGSPLLFYLAAAGVGTLGIVDDDMVELSNLQRQILYSTNQISTPKVSSAKETLLDLNPAINVNTYYEKLSIENANKLIDQYDIIVDGTDNFYSRNLIHDTCFKLEKPYVYASANQFKGYCSIFSGKNNPCFRCLFPTPPNDNSIPNCNEGGVIGVLPGILGVIQATEVIKWILQIGKSLEKRLLIIDLLNMSFKEISISKNPDCKLCVHHEPFSMPDNSSTCENNINLKKYGITSEQMTFFLQQNSDAILIDVRSKKEHDLQNIGGELFPLAELPNRLHALDPKKPIVLYCHSGQRSISALKILLEKKFLFVRYLFNGLTSITNPNLFPSSRP